MVVIAPAALVCGAESCVGFAELAADRELLLQEFLRLENGLPSHDTFSRLFRLRDPQAFGRVLDMAFDEDRARNRKDNGAENLSLVRKLALNLLRKARPELPVSRQTQRRKDAKTQDGPTTSQEPSSAKCDSPASALRPPFRFGPFHYIVKLREPSLTGSLP
jgi:hypothetical protein